MTTLYKLVAVLMCVILPVTQTGCVTAALVKMGEDRQGTLRTEQPVGYTAAVRDGHDVVLKFNTTVDSDGNQHTDVFDSVRVDLASVYWRQLGPAPIDPYCTREMWQRLVPGAAPQPNAPLILDRPGDYRQILSLHQQNATGFPPMTVQTRGIDAWILCGSGDAIGITEVPIPPPPQPGTEGGRTTGEIIAIVFLFPFALAVDILGAVFYLAVCLYGRCR